MMLDYEHNGKWVESVVDETTPVDDKHWSVVVIYGDAKKIKL